MKKLVLIAAMLVVFGIGEVANAELTIIGDATYGSQSYNLIYDNDLQISWLNYTKDPDTWENQMTWASNLGANLSVTLFSGYTTTNNWQTNWRLPTSLNEDGSGPFLGYGVPGSEMTHLFYTELGNKGAYDKNSQDGGIFNPNFGLTNKGPFTNLLPVVYWSGTVYVPPPGFPDPEAWSMVLPHGFQHPYSQEYSYYALAVHDGNVASPVPIPPSVLLFGSGLIGLVGVRRKMQR